MREGSLQSLIPTGRGKRERTTEKEREEERQRETERENTHFFFLAADRCTF